MIHENDIFLDLIKHLHNSPFTILHSPLFMKNILLKIYSLYAVILFFCVTTILLLLYLIIAILPDRIRTLCVMNMNRVVIRIWGFLVGVRMETIGKENLPADMVCVIASNHVNMIDIPLMGQAIIHYFKPLGKKEIIYVPIVGQIFAMTTILVNRSNAESRAKSMEKMMNWLKRGCSIFVFPEGTRNKTGKPLKDFYDGAFRIAIQGQVPLVPVVQLHSKEMQPVNSWNLFPGKAVVEILKPISTEGMTEEDVPKLKEKVYKIIEDRLFEVDDYWKMQDRSLYK